MTAMTAATAAVNDAPPAKAQLSPVTELDSGGYWCAFLGAVRHSKSGEMEVSPARTYSRAVY